MNDNQRLLLHELPAERRFQLLVDNISDYAIYMLTPEGLINSWNSGAQRFKGYRAEEVIGTHFSRFYTDEDRARDLPNRALAIAAGEGRFENEGWRVRKDGTRFWANAIIDRIADDSGYLIGFAKITRDITDRKLAQDALRESEERFRLLVKGVTDYSLFMLSPDGIVTNWNLGAQRIKGYTSEEAVGLHFSHFYTDEDRARGLPQTALATAKKEGRFENEGWRTRKDGSRFWAHVIIDPIYDDFGNHIGFAKVTRDITEKREAEEARQKASQFQMQKLDSLGKLTGGVAHDFNNLLAIVVNGLELITREIQSPSGVRVLESMKRATARGSALTQQLLAYARQQPLKQERCNLNRVIEDFEAVLQQACHPGISLSLKLSKHLHDSELDATQFETALLNLVVNARDAVDETGAVLISTENFKSDEDFGALQLAPGNYVKVSVRDTGCGMASEVVDRAFEPFFTTKPIGKGTGLGLSQVYGFVKQSGGDVVLETELGKGTTISLVFPAIMNEEQRAAPEDAEPDVEKVLVVDDEPDLLETTAELFRSMDYDVVTARNGREALELLEKMPNICILFTDVVMTGDLNGVELARTSQRLYPHIKVILASGYPLPALTAKHGELNDFAFINKPYRFSELVKKLRTVSHT